MNKGVIAGLALVAVGAAAGIAAWQFGYLPGDKTDKVEGSVARGHALAAEYCSRCHSIERGQQSPVKEAPPFSSFAQRWPLENLEESLAEGIMVGHEKYQMPVFQFTPEQIQDFIAYLKTIQEPAPNAPQTSPPESSGN